MDTPLSPVGSPVSLEKLAYNAIKDAIITFRLRPGQSLVESDLASQLGISKTPVRDALMKLEKEGFVNKIPYTGTYVSEVNKKTLIEIFEIRASLEALATRLATPLMTAEDQKKIQEAIHQHAQAAKQGNLAEASKANSTYHELIIALADNRWLTQILNNFEDHLRRFRILSNFQKGRLEKSVNEHQAVLDAMMKRDAESAERAMRQHLLSTLEDLKAQDFDELVRQAVDQTL